LHDHVQFALASLIAMPELDAGGAGSVTQGPMGCTLVDCGLRPDYFRDVLTRFLAEIHMALESGQPLHYG